MLAGWLAVLVCVSAQQAHRRRPRRPPRSAPASTRCSSTCPCSTRIAGQSAASPQRTSPCSKRESRARSWATQRLSCRRLPAAVAPAGIDSVPPDVVRNDFPDGRIVVILLDPFLQRVMVPGRVTIADPPGITALRATAVSIVNGLGPGDLAAVGHTMYGVPQNFTTDKARLKKAIDTTAFGTIVVGTIGVQVSSHRMAWTQGRRCRRRAPGGRLSTITIGGRLDTTFTIALAAVGIGLALRRLADGAAGAHRRFGAGSPSTAARDLLVTTAATRCRTSPCATTSTTSASATPSSPMPCATACAWCRPIPSARRTSGPRRGRPSATTPPARAGTWPCSRPARPGCRSTSASGMSHRYIGDEAVVDTRALLADGGRNKGLRQAVNRIANTATRSSSTIPPTPTRHWRRSSGG